MFSTGASTDCPLNEVILPVMRECFFGGATYAVLLLQNGQGDELARDLAGFINEECLPKPGPRGPSEGPE
jgi:hypothetical protein